MGRRPVSTRQHLDHALILADFPAPCPAVPIHSHFSDLALAGLAEKSPPDVDPFSGPAAAKNELELGREPGADREANGVSRNTASSEKTESSRSMSCLAHPLPKLSTIDRPNPPVSRGSSVEVAPTSCSGSRGRHGTERREPMIWNLHPKTPLAIALGLALAGPAVAQEACPPATDRLIALRRAWRSAGRRWRLRLERVACRGAHLPELGSDQPGGGLRLDHQQCCEFDHRRVLLRDAWRNSEAWALAQERSRLNGPGCTSLRIAKWLCNAGGKVIQITQISGSNPANRV